jgi:Ser/Thr protein kinase RdoA (MazF antagonist)/4-aminobutyrate aminotransferase-like enzyme
MQDTVSDVLDTSADAAPDAGSGGMEQVEDLLREHWGLSGQIFPLELQRGAGYLVDNGHMRYLLEARALDDEAGMRLEHEAMRHIIRDPDGPAVAEPVAARDGADVVTATIEGEARCLRLLTVLEGDPPPVAAEFSDTAAADFAAMIASLAKSLEDFEPSASDGAQEDDFRKAGPHTVSLLSQVTDQEARDLIARAMVAALRRVHPLTAGFRLGLTVADLSPDNLTGEGEGDGWRPTGITELTGIGRGWYVAALAKTCARILAGRQGEPSSILPAVSAYHAIQPLNESEAEALWPLIIAQAALDAATAAKRHALAPDDEAAAAGAAERLAVLVNAGSVTGGFMHASILSACGIEVAVPDMAALLPDIDAEQIRLVDLGVTSPLLHDGNWTDPDCDWKLLARVAWDTGMGATRYGEYRLSRTRVDEDAEPETFALHVDICLPAGTTIAAPFGGTVMETVPRLELRGDAVSLFIEGMDCIAEKGASVARGETIGTVSGAEGSVGGLRLALGRDPETPPPLFCAPSQAAIWRHLAPSPATLLGIDRNAPAVLPGRRVRAWREHVFDGTGLALLDMSGRGSLIGHGHPATGAAAYRQHLLLDVSGDSEAGLDGLKAALMAIGPSGLDHVTVFPDQRSALEAVMQVARIRTGRDAVVMLDAGDPESGDDDAGAEIAALIAEPVLGADGLAARFEAVRAAGGLAVADERRTGYGRLGRATWGVEHETATVDIVLAGSCEGSDTAAIYCRTELAEAFEPFGAPPSPIHVATSLAALTAITEEGMRANAIAAGDILEHGLQAIAEDSEHVVELTGAGLVWSMQLSAELPDAEVRLENMALHGADGPARLLIAPPLCVGSKSVERYLEHLRDALVVSQD